MKIYITAIAVDDQEKAFEFYTKVLGFETKNDIPMGQHRYMTFTSPGDSHGVELSIEPAAHPAVVAFREALVKDGIPYTAFAVDNLDEEHARLESLGVEFTQPPVTHEGYSTAVFDDTCGNLIQIVQLPENA